jgi:asparagine synthase (glutamine-hydrolysing)
MRRLCTYRHFSDEFQQELFTPDFLASTLMSRSSIDLQFNEKNFSEMLIESKLINGFYLYQSFHTTKSFERFDVDFYLPTINKDLMTFITSLPSEWVNGGTSLQRLTNSKKINRLFHKKALQRYLRKDEIYNRSFDIPWYRILKPRKHLLEVLRRRLKKRGWYQERALDRLFDEFPRQAAKDHELLELKHHGYRIFTLLSLEVWCTEFIDGGLNRPASMAVPLEEYLAS